MSDRIRFQWPVTNMPKSIVNRVLREATVKKWLVKSRPRFKPDHVAKRLSWATAHTRRY